MELISEMKKCKTVSDCREVATIDAYGEDEVAAGWMTCIEEMFRKFKHVKVLGNEVILEGFDLKELQVMAKCRNGRKLAFVSLESIEFPKLSKSEKLWLDSLKNWPGVAHLVKHFGTSQSTKMYSEARRVFLMPRTSSSRKASQSSPSD